MLHQRLRSMNTLAIRIDTNVIEWRTPKNTVHIILNETRFLSNCMCTIAPARQWCLHRGEICVFPEAITCLFKDTKDFVAGQKIVPARLVMLLVS